MGAIKRSTEPLATVPSHGAAGYDRGCGCTRCRDGHKARLKRYRDRKAAGTVGTNVVRFPATAGKFERDVMAMCHDIGAKGAEADLLVDMMVFNARMLDQMAETGRWHLANAAQKAIRDMRDELRNMAGVKPPTPSPGDNLQGFLNGLTKQGE